MNVKEETRCRVCRGNLRWGLDLGLIHPSAFLTYEERGGKTEHDKVPLILAECEDCGLIQLKHTVNLDLMYRQYWYSSSLNKSMVSSLQDIVRYSQSVFPLKENDTVLDIGCNDGTLLGLYPKNVTKVGYDPSMNLELNSDFFFINDYFNLSLWGHHKAKIITAIAMFYDLPDPHQFVEDVVEVLDEKGIFVVQFTDLLSMFKATAFDNICHEHLEYYKLADVVNLLETHGLEVIDVCYNDVNGGSVRITAAHDGAYLPSRAVSQYLKQEAEYLSKYDLQDFNTAIYDTVVDVRTFLDKCSTRGKSVFLLGASTKGNTFLQVCEISRDDIPYAAEVNRDKFGMYTVGSNIYIIPEEEAFAMKPDYFLVPVWHFKKDLLTKKHIIDYLEAGGHLVFPLPYFHIVGKDTSYDKR